MKTFLCLGAGVESVALYILSLRGDIERAEFALYGDPGADHPEAYAQIRNLTEWASSQAAAIPLHVVSSGRLADAVLTASAKIPAYMRSKGGREQIVAMNCADGYRLAPMRSFLQTKGGDRWRALMSLTRESVDRVRTSRTAWIQNAYPLIDQGITKADAKAIVQEAGFEILEGARAMCVFCPLQGDESWLSLKINHESTFATADNVDRGIRTAFGREAFLHRSRRPLADVELGSKLRDTFTNDCNGVCGV